MSNWYTFRQIEQQINKTKHPKGWLLFILGSILLIIAGSWLILSMLSSMGIHPFGNHPSDMKTSLLNYFSPSVQYWEEDVLSWAEIWDLDPLLIATVMQIESCGDPQAVSGAGAQGLFQVMPYHFHASENMLDPQINAQRGLAYLSQSYALAKGDIEQTLAGYNGGHGQINCNSSIWPDETQRYVLFGAAIYEQAKKTGHQRTALNTWLNAGGENLCQQAEAVLGLE